MTFLKVATPRMDEEQHEADVQCPMIDLARDGLISVVDINRLNFRRLRNERVRKFETVDQ
jgi:hypothetical protein